MVMEIMEAAQVAVVEAAHQHQIFQSHRQISAKDPVIKDNNRTIMDHHNNKAVAGDHQIHREATIVPAMEVIIAIVRVVVVLVEEAAGAAVAMETINVGLTHESNNLNQFYDRI